MFVKRRLAAIDAVRELVFEYGGGSLPQEAAKRYGREGFDIAWRVFLDASGSAREFHILADGDFPYSAPRIALPDVKGLDWPHVERDGFLCLLPPDAAVSQEDPAGVARYLLKEAHDLVADSVGGKNVQDFRDEFLSYWSIATDTEADLTSIVEPRNPGRRIHIFRSKGNLVAADSKEELIAGLRRRGLADHTEQIIEDGVLLWLPEALLPKEYPVTAEDVWRIAERCPDAGRQTLEDLVVRMPERLCVLLGAKTAHGTCFGAVSLIKPKQDTMTKGFRPDHLDPQVALKRYLGPSAKVVKHRVHRGDHLWIHGRDRDERQRKLREAKVAILGCGSLGATVARLLAQAGTGNLFVVDPRTMDWCNVGRHTLGASSVQKYKADELATQIGRDLPHLHTISASRDRVGPAANGLSQKLLSCDLIVSTMGNWAGEGYLNELQRYNTKVPPVVYGWLEPQALAAHAVVILQSGACFRCGVNDHGRPNFEAIRWPTGHRMLQAPACGATFTPYGPTELCWAQALVAETALDVLVEPPRSAFHRVWVGQTQRVREGGGAWTEALVSEVGDVGDGGLTLKRDWPVSRACPVCGAGRQ